MRDKIPVVFILGCGHSGSTLLDLLLNAHSKMVGTGELEKIGVKAKVRSTTCSCGRDFLECPFWANYVRTRESNSFFAGKFWQLAQSKLDFLLNKARYTPLIREGDNTPRKGKEIPLDTYIRDSEDLYDYILDTSGAQVVVDSSKNTTRANALEQHSRRIQPYFIHLIRDGRGVAWTYFNKYGRFRKYMLRWLTDNLKVEVLRVRTRAPFIRVSYRALTRQPERELKRICAFVGQPYEPAMLEYQGIEHHHVGGNAGTVKKAAPIREDLQWKTNMPLQYRVFSTLCLGLVHSLYQYVAERRH